MIGFFIAGAAMSESNLHQQDANHSRLKEILAELEAALQNIPSDTPNVEILRSDFAALKQHLALPSAETGLLRAQISKTQSSAQDLMDTVEGEILKDSPYLAELGRILGMI